MSTVPEYCALIFSVLLYSSCANLWWLYFFDIVYITHLFSVFMSWAVETVRMENVSVALFDICIYPH